MYTEKLADINALDHSIDRDGACGGRASLFHVRVWLLPIVHFETGWDTALATRLPPTTEFKIIWSAVKVKI